jgi:hypothetical protein
MQNHSSGDEISEKVEYLKNRPRFLEITIENGTDGGVPSF